MKSVYIDTNLFLYLSEKKSSFYLESVELIRHLKNDRTLILTSSESIQEIVYVSQKMKKLSYGLKTIEKVFEVIDELLSINKKTINYYLDLVIKHSTSDSRDSLHVATCIENKIGTIITYDYGFKKFKEIKVFTPQEFLNKFNL